MLRLATREADIVGMDLRQDRDALPDAFPAGMDRRVGWVRDEAGDRFDDLEISVLRVLGRAHRLEPTAGGGRGRSPARSRIAPGLTITPEDVLESPYTLIGSVPDLVAKLRRGRERWGINSILVGWFDDARLADFDPVVEQLAGT